MGIDLIFFGICFFIYRYRNRGDKVVIWLRKFHHRDRRFKFKKILLRACKGLASPITIRDSKEKGDITGLLWIIYFLQSTIYLFLFAFYGILEDLWFYIESPDNIAIFPKEFIYLLLKISYVLIAGYIIIKLSLRSGYIKLSEENAITKSNKIINKYGHGKGRAFGLTIIACNDNFWKNVVNLFITKADFVIIDITRISEGILWEIQEAKNNLPLKSIIFAFNTIDGSEMIPASTKEKLNSILTETEQESIKHFMYKSSYSGGKDYKKDVSDLRKYLTD